jgi:hypothetical protein
MGPRLKLSRFVHGFIDRHGKPRCYFRRAGFKKSPLPSLPMDARLYGSLRNSAGRTAAADRGAHGRGPAQFVPLRSAISTRPISFVETVFTSNLSQHH